MGRAKNEKRKTAQDRRIELPNQDKIRTIREKVTYKYQGILKVDIIKHAEMKEKRKSNTAGNRENYSKSNYIAEISLKG